jgi:uncharacterized membrane protein
VNWATAKRLNDGFGGILGILLIGVIVWLAIQFVNKNRPGNPFASNWQEPSHDKENALDILKKRYARGEICLEEYRLMKKGVKQAWFSLAIHVLCTL